MQMRALITNFGKHSDEKLGYAMAADLVENHASLTGQDALDMRKLENQLGDMLADHFKQIADRENAGIAAKGHEHLAESLEAHPEHSIEIEGAVLAAYAASPFAFERPVAESNVPRGRAEVGQDRSAHASRLVRRFRQGRTRDVFDRSPRLRSERRAREAMEGSPRPGNT